ncbi:hypothetical protein [Citrobacter pasteurii]|nr:hypothetical protein [Citrobacter pasteurii]
MRYLQFHVLSFFNNRLMSNEMTIAARPLRFKKRKSISKKKKA